MIRFAQNQQEKGMGADYNRRRDADLTPFRREKNTNREGGWRLPAFVRSATPSNTKVDDTNDRGVRG
jgi:hypothetical protein